MYSNAYNFKISESNSIAIMYNTFQYSVKIKIVNHIPNVLITTRNNNFTSTCIFMNTVLYI